MPPERLDRVLPMIRNGIPRVGSGYQGLGRVGIANTYEGVDGLIPGFSERGCAESLDRLLQKRVVSGVLRGAFITGGLLQLSRGGRPKRSWLTERRARRRPRNTLCRCASKPSV